MVNETLQLSPGTRGVGTPDMHQTEHLVAGGVAEAVVYQLENDQDRENIRILCALQAERGKPVMLLILHESATIEQAGQMVDRGRVAIDVDVAVLDHISSTRLMGKALRTLRCKTSEN
jgi:hypothetical protein